MPPPSDDHVTTVIQSPKRIDTREELIIALTEAAELEHGLLVQYLFAAFSMKRFPDEGVTWPQLERMRAWERAILRVAREEMAHLATVNNLLLVFGGAPHFNRPNLPQRDTYYFESPVEFTLQRFSVAALERFIEFERPEPEKGKKFMHFDGAPDPLSYTRVGDLYRQIDRAITLLDWNTLFKQEVQEAQDGNSWGAGLNLVRIRVEQDAHDAIAFIIENGEGTPAAATTSHFAVFTDMRRELADMQAADGSFDPARRVAENPLTRLHRDITGKSPCTLITRPGTRRLAELLNSVYATMLSAHMQFYAWQGDLNASKGSRDQRIGLRDVVRCIMSGVLRPIAETLTRLPVADDASGPTAGPGFELYADLRIPSSWKIAWDILEERLRVHAADARELLDDGAPPRIRYVAENLHLLAETVHRLKLIPVS